MYISAIRTGDNITVWERAKDGTRWMKNFKAPYNFYVPHKNGEHETIYGDKVAKFEFDTISDFNHAVDIAKNKGMKLYESDIPPEIKVLSEHYYEADVPNLHVTFFDIEVDYDKQIGFAGVENPYAPINSVSLYHRHTNRNVVIAVPPKETKWKPGYAPQEFIDQLNDVCALPDEFNNEVIFCVNEKELLLRFLDEIEDSDVVCGWNSDVFDIPYIGRRLQKIGKKYFNMLSFSCAPPPRWRTIEIMKREVELLDLQGRINADYMVLFKKYEMEERPTYKLEAIADEFLPELPKLEYEGSLADLYRKNFAYFVRYNIRDTEILEGFEQKLGYVQLANEMYHLSTGLFKHVTGTLKLAEFAAINYCHYELGKIVNNIKEPDESEKIQGAYVLAPTIGLHEWIGSVDIASLYPSAIRSLNISPETLRGQFEEHEQATHLISEGDSQELTLEVESEIPAKSALKQWENDFVTKPAYEWREFFLENKLSVSGYGTVFDQSEPGIIPSILALWYDTRKKFKKLKAEAIQNNEKQKAEYYDRIQYVYKIKLNSFYGALTNQYFRFYDLRMGKSTTGSGRLILRHQCAQICLLIDGKYTLPNRKVVDKNGKENWGYTDQYSVLYGDTDSTYFKIPATSYKTAVKVADGIGELVNESFQPFMRKMFLCQPGYDNIIQSEREIVSSKGIFVDKKRYILHVVNDEGKEVDKPKVIGLDTKKTTLPREISKVLNNFIERFLKDEEWEQISKEIVDFKEELRNTKNIMKIGLPKGIKGIEEYTKLYEVYGENTRLPGHVAAGIFYNICREENNDKISMPIVSGMKIKVFYLTKNYGKFKSIAIPVDIEQIPDWFYNFPIDREANILRLVDKPLGNIIKAIGKEVPTKQSLFEEEYIEF